MGINLLGGISLPKNKDDEMWNDILEIRPPEFYSVPIMCTNGLPAEPVVKPGDKVKQGALIAKPTTNKGSFVYSPTSGKVVSIIDKLTPNGFKCPHVVITNDNKMESVGFLPIEDINAQELLKRLAVSGIVDSNFGGMPTYLRYTLNAVEKQFTLYVVMSNTDPYLSANESLTIHRTAEVVQGAKYFAQILSSKQIVFVFTQRAKKARKILVKFLKKQEPALKYSIKEILNTFPSDNIKLLMHRFKPKKKMFVESDSQPKAFVEDAITCYSFFNAVKNNKPIDYRVITVSGNNIVRKGNYIVKNGTSFEHVLEVLGTKDNTKPFKVLNGGIMMGIAQYSTDVSCNPETQSLTFIDEKEFNVQKELPCINCGKCVDVCPMNLLPNKLDENCVNRKTYDASVLGIRSCIECGCCSYVCPSKRYLTQRITNVKREIEGGKA